MASDSDSRPCPHDGRRRRPRRDRAVPRGRAGAVGSLRPGADGAVLDLDSPAVRLGSWRSAPGSPCCSSTARRARARGPARPPSSPGFRCIVLDRPGWGLSSPLDFSRHAYGRSSPTCSPAPSTPSTLDARARGRRLDRRRVGAAPGAARIRLGLAAIVLLGGAPLRARGPGPAFIRLLASPLGAVMVRLPRQPAGARRSCASRARREPRRRAHPRRVRRLARRARARDRLHAPRARHDPRHRRAAPVPAGTHLRRRRARRDSAADAATCSAPRIRSAPSTSGSAS